MTKRDYEAVSHRGEEGKKVYSEFPDIDLECYQTQSGG
jgi:hypothetical protein